MLRGSLECLSNSQTEPNVSGRSRRSPTFRIVHELIEDSIAIEKYRAIHWNGTCVTGGAAASSVTPGGGC